MRFNSTSNNIISNILFFAKCVCLMIKNAMSRVKFSLKFRPFSIFSQSISWPTNYALNKRKLVTLVKRKHLCELHYWMSFCCFRTWKEKCAHCNFSDWKHQQQQIKNINIIFHTVLIILWISFSHIFSQFIYFIPLY